MTQENPSQLPLENKADGLYFSGSALRYRVTGLTHYNLERLRITLKAESSDNPSLFHIDSIDLYNSRCREMFVENCVKFMKAQSPLVNADLLYLITLLEAERVSMREKGCGAQVPTMTEAETTEALNVLKSKDLLQRIITDFEGLGYIGEKSNKLLGYIAAVSRLQSDPLALLILSRSGAGKTSLQDAVCKFVPPESAIQYTRLTGQSLFYRDPNALKNKVLAIEEEEGMQDAMYSIKTLISSQKLSIAATRTDAKTGKFSVEEYSVSGPVVVMVSTTNPDALDDETKQRFLVLTIDETPEQTKNILQAQRIKNSAQWYQSTMDSESLARLHHNMQRLLKPLTVTFPEELKFTWPNSRLQMRREQGKFFSLIKAIVLLHQYQRKVVTVTRADGVKLSTVQATQKDVDLALELGRLVFARNVDDVSPTGRTLLVEAVKMVQEKYESTRNSNPKTDLTLSDIPFTRKELREETGWSETQVRRNLDQLVELGYVGRINGRQGSTFRYLLLDDGSADPRLVFGTEKTAFTENQRLNPESSPLRHNFVSTSPMVEVESNHRVNHNFATSAVAQY